jgi:ribosomal protein S18 acetylase RimI-like enzyme
MVVNLMINYKGIMQIIKYTSAYRENCISIFKSNLPIFFAHEELQQFEAFLDQAVDQYYVVKIDGRLVGSGGIFFDEKNNEAGLSWGMIDRCYHGQGIGMKLTCYRLDLLKKLYTDKIIKIETSQHTAGFYKKNGFRILDIVPNGFGEGLDKYIMKLE